MHKFRSFAKNRPVLCVLSCIILWFILSLSFTWIASILLGRPFSDIGAMIIGRFTTIIFLLLLLWRLNWLIPAGIPCLGTWQVWLITLGGIFYLATASLYAFYGKLLFSISSLSVLPDSLNVVITNLAVALSEEILFRGLVIYILIRAWGKTRLGMIGSVLVSSLFFALMHITQAFTNSVSLSSAILLTAQIMIVSFWWGALIVTGRSIWPAVMAHFIGNTIVALEGLTTTMIEPNILAYQRLLWFSLLIGALGIWMLSKTSTNPYHLEECKR